MFKNLILIFSVAASQAAGQDESKNLSTNYQVVIDPNTGDAIVKLKSDATAQVNEGAALQSDSIYFGLAEPEKLDGLALFGADGSLQAVYPKPKFPQQELKLLDNLDNGGSLQKVAIFGSSLPTAEQARELTEASINAALSMICSAEPRPEKLNVDVSLGVQMGLEGTFALSMEWMPARDCK